MTDSAAPASVPRPVPLLFDRILCDVPCSGDGTIRKNSNIWRLWSLGGAIGLHPLQLSIAWRAAQLLKVGGRLVYSTCSLNPFENEAVVAELIRHSRGALRVVDVSDKLPGLLREPGMESWPCNVDVTQETRQSRKVAYKAAAATAATLAAAAAEAAAKAAAEGATDADKAAAAEAQAAADAAAATAEAARLLAPVPGSVVTTAADVTMCDVNSLKVVDSLWFAQKRRLRLSLCCPTTIATMKAEALAEAAAGITHNDANATAASSAANAYQGIKGKGSHSSNGYAAANGSGNGKGGKANPKGGKKRPAAKEGATEEEAEAHAAAVEAGLSARLPPFGRNLSQYPSTMLHGPAAGSDAPTGEQLGLRHCVRILPHRQVRCL